MDGLLLPALSFNDQFGRDMSEGKDMPEGQMGRYVHTTTTNHTTNTQLEVVGMWGGVRPAMFVP